VRCVKEGEQLLEGEKSFQKQGVGSPHSALSAVHNPRQTELWKEV
jgi:hypothetical protein